MTNAANTSYEGRVTSSGTTRTLRPGPPQPSIPTRSGASPTTRTNRTDLQDLTSYHRCRSGAQNRWLSVASTVAVLLPSVPSTSMVNSTICFAPMPVMSAVTARASVWPVVGSVAMTLSPILTWSIGLVVPSAISTAVPAAKLLQLDGLGWAWAD